MSMQPCSWTEGCTPLLSSRNIFLCDRRQITITCKIPKNVGISERLLVEAVRKRAGSGLAGLSIVDRRSDRILLRGDLQGGGEGDSVLSKCKGSITVKEGVVLEATVEKTAPPFPDRHSWDSFFRDAPDMDEMKPGERPDTLHLTGLPVEWFGYEKSGGGGISEAAVRRAMDKFGKIRCVDVPACDPYRDRMKEEMRGYTRPKSEIFFEAYVQYIDYAAFVRAMDGLRGKKLLKKEPDGVCWSAVIEVDFDKTKHLSEASIRRRGIIRDRLRTKEKNDEERKKRAASEEKRKLETERRKREESEREEARKTREREKRRKERQLAKLKEKESAEICTKIAEEEKKLIRTQRRLQSIRLVEELFKRIQRRDGRRIDAATKESSRKKKNSDDTKKVLRNLERALLRESESSMRAPRDSLVYKYKSIREKELEERKQKLQIALEGNIVLKSVFEDDKRGTPSISSLSSDSDERNSKIKKSVKNDHCDRTNNIPWPNPAEIGGYLPYGIYPDYNPQLGVFSRYLQPQESFRGRYMSRRARGFPRNNFRGGPRMPQYDEYGQAYYRYFKNIIGNHAGGRRSRSRSKNRSRRRSYSSSRSSYSRSRSRSRRRSASRRRGRYTRSRSRSRSRRSRTRSRSRSRSRGRSRSRSGHRNGSRSHSRHKSRSRSRERTRSKSKTKSRSRSREKQNNVKQKPKAIKTPTDLIPASVIEKKNKTANNAKLDNKTAEKTSNRRSKSWSSPRDDPDKRWSKSPIASK